MSGRELYKIMIKNDLDFVIDKIIEKNNDLTIKELKIEELEKEIERLNNIINRIDSFVDRTIEVIKQQPTGDDEWILERLNGIKYLIELKDSD